MFTTALVLLFLEKHHEMIGNLPFHSSKRDVNKKERTLKYISKRTAKIKPKIVTDCYQDNRQKINDS